MADKKVSELGVASALDGSENGCLPNSLGQLSQHGR